MHHPTDRITHTTAFVTPVVEHCQEREIAQWVPYKQSEKIGRENETVPNLPQPIMAETDSLKIGRKY